MFKDNFEILPGTGLQTLVTAAPALYAAGSAINAKIKYGQEVDKIESLLDERQDITNPYKDLENPYKNLPVATQAARFQAENADIALANTLDTLRSTGAAAGGATALAQAALQSQQGISASLEKQEAQNARLRAQGQLQVDTAKAKGESFRMRMQEARDVRDVNRIQRQADIFKATQIANERAAFDQLGAAAEQFTSGIVPAKINPGDQVTSGVDMDVLKQGLTEKEKDEAIINARLDPIEVEDDFDQQIIEDVDFMDPSGSQAVSVFGKGMLPVVDSGDVLGDSGIIDPTTMTQYQFEQARELRRRTDLPIEEIFKRVGVTGDISNIYGIK